VVENFLWRRLQIVEPRVRFEAAVAEIMRSRGQTRVDQLAEQIGWSQRQLEREFRCSAGISPKTLARTIRFQNLLRLAGESTLREWATLALAVGYADQPHMVREFREFAGRTPTACHDEVWGLLAKNFVSPQRLNKLLG
jgi:transcriptional regulator GlxA family with amidase domain